MVVTWLRKNFQMTAKASVTEWRRRLEETNRSNQLSQIFSTFSSLLLFFLTSNSFKKSYQPNVKRLFILATLFKLFWINPIQNLKHCSGWRFHFHFLLNTRYPLHVQFSLPSIPIQIPPSIPILSSTPWNDQNGTSFFLCSLSDAQNVLSSSPPNHISHPSYAHSNTFSLSSS